MADVMWTHRFQEWISYSPKEVQRQTMRKIILHDTGGDFSCLQDEPIDPTKTRGMVYSELIKAYLKNPCAEVIEEYRAKHPEYYQSDSENDYSDLEDYNLESDSDRLSYDANGPIYYRPYVPFRRKNFVPQKFESSSADNFFFYRNRPQRRTGRLCPWYMKSINILQKGMLIYLLERILYARASVLAQERNEESASSCSSPEFRQTPSPSGSEADSDYEDSPTDYESAGSSDMEESEHDSYKQIKTL